jgi:predicted O-methyltransferase YrrM
MQGRVDQPDSSWQSAHTLLEEVYATGTIEDERGRQWPILPTGVDAAQGAALRDLMTSMEAARTVETGFALGLSAAHIAIGLLRSGQPDVHHVAIDPTQRSGWGNAGVRRPASPSRK